jgi:hypothetical protein
LIILVGAVGAATSGLGVLAAGAADSSSEGSVDEGELDDDGDGEGVLTSPSDLPLVAHQMPAPIEELQQQTHSTIAAITAGFIYSNMRN